MITTPQILQTKAQAAAVIHLTVPRSAMIKVFGPAVGELMIALAKQGVEPVGAIFAHHLKMRPDTFGFRIGREGYFAGEGYRARETGRGSCSKGCSRPFIMAVSYTHLTLPTIYSV